MGFSGLGGLQECKDYFFFFEIKRGRLHFLGRVVKIFFGFDQGLHVAAPGPYPIRGPLP